MKIKIANWIKYGHGEGDGFAATFSASWSDGAIKRYLYNDRIEMGDNKHEAQDAVDNHLEIFETKLVGVIG